MDLLKKLAGIEDEILRALLANVERRARGVVKTLGARRDDGPTLFDVPGVGNKLDTHAIKGNNALRFAFFENCIELELTEQRSKLYGTELLRRYKEYGGISVLGANDRTLGKLLREWVKMKFKADAVPPKTQAVFLAALEARHRRSWISLRCV